jgi:hypothetical protein
MSCDPHTGGRTFSGYFSFALTPLGFSQDGNVNVLVGMPVIAEGRPGIQGLGSVDRSGVCQA